MQDPQAGQDGDNVAPDAGDGRKDSSLLNEILDDELWLSYNEKGEDQGEKRKITLEEIRNDICSLYDPSLPKPSLPFSRHIHGQAAVESNNWRKQQYRQFVRIILQEMVDKHNKFSEDDASWLFHTNTYHVIRDVVPVLLDALEELLSTSEFLASREKDRDQDWLLVPLDFVASFLMRHNPKHPCVSKRRFQKRRLKRKKECMHIVHEFFAEQAVQRQLQSRKAVWESRNGKMMMRLWKRFCPKPGDRLSFENIKEALEEFSGIFALETSDMADAEQVFKLLDTDGGGDISFIEFEEVVGTLLKNTERAMNAIRKIGHTESLSANERIKTWAKKKAFEKLEQRVKGTNVDCARLFNSFASKSTGGNISVSDLRHCAKHVKYELRLAITEEEEEEVIREMVQSNKYVGYETFTRTLAEMIEISHKKSQDDIDKKSRRLAEARLSQNVAKVQSYLYELECLEVKAKHLRQQKKKYKHRLGNLMETEHADHVEDDVIKALNEMDDAIPIGEDVDQGIHAARKMILNSNLFSDASERDLNNLISNTKNHVHGELTNFNKVHHYVKKVESTVGNIQAQKEEQLKRDIAARAHTEKLALQKAREEAQLAVPKVIKADAPISPRENPRSRRVSRASMARKNRQNRRSSQIRKAYAKGDVSEAAKKCDLDKLKLCFSNLPPREKVKAANEKDKNGSTPLMHVAWNGDVACAKLLLESGANPTDTNLRLNTALHFSFERGNTDFASLMVAYAGKEALQLKNSRGKTPVDLNPDMEQMVLH